MEGSSSSTGSDVAKPASKPGPLLNSSYIDVGEIIEAEDLNSNVKLRKDILTSKWDESHTHQFPSRLAGKKNRKFNSKWLADYPWMRYSKSNDSVYCAPCVLFGRNESKEKTSITPVSDWANMTTYVKRHLKPESQHHGVAGMADDFIKIQQEEDKPITFKISKQAEDQAIKNRHIIRKIFEVILLCGRQNVPLRSHDDDKNNFISILHEIAKEDIVLSEHLANVTAREKYTSPTIQNEIIAILGSQNQNKIVMDCNESGLFTLMADETTDKSTKEQVTICLRFIDPHNRYELREEFLAFQQATDGTTGEALADLLLSSLRKYGIDVNQMCAQGYDGASNMSGRYRGVQARVREINPEAVYIHCKAHCLNLAIVHSCKEPCVRTVMGTVQDIAFAFDYSSKRLLAICEELNNDENVKEQMDQRTKLRTLCETRWTSRADSLFTFLQAFPVVAHALEHLQDNGDDKAGQHMHAMLRWDLIIGLVVCEHILQSTVFLSTFLQNVTCDLMEAAKESEVVINTLKNERNDPEVWNALFEKASGLAEQFEIIPSKPRTAGLQRHRNNVPAESPTEYWKRALYIPFMDHMTLELTDRLLGGPVQDRFLAQYLVPSCLHQITLDITGRLFAVYAHFLAPHGQHVFNAEMQRWETKWNGADVKPTSLQETLRACNRDLYPCISTMITVLITMPVSTSTAERSFSSLRRIKIYLRSTMGQERLSDLSLLHIHRDQQIDINSAIERFVTDKKEGPILNINLLFILQRKKMSVKY